MKLDNLTIGELKEVSSLLSCEKQTKCPYKVGEKYLIRTVTHYYTGRCKEIYKNELVLEESAWIADTGRYHEAIKNGTLKEIEPIIGDLILGRGGIIDCVSYLNDLPKEVK